MAGQATQGRDYRFLTGVVMGGVVGAGLAMWLAPRAVRSVRKLGDDAVEGLTRTGQGLRDGACDIVIRAAQDVEQKARDVERYATDAKTKVV
jgi:gas vesicle protein